MIYAEYMYILIREDIYNRGKHTGVSMTLTLYIELYYYRSYQYHSALPSLSMLSALIKNRVSQKPKSSLHTHRTLVKEEHDDSDIEISQL